MVYDEIEIDGKKKALFNVSKGLINYSQRNNEYIWSRKNVIVKSTNECNVTSICMGSSYAGWRFPKEPYPQYKQEEDRLAAFCLENPEVSEYFRIEMPTLWKEWQDGKQDALPPNQIHEILAYATNLWFGSTVVKFSNAVNLVDMFNEIIYKNLPVVVSGVFPKAFGSEETINHIVVMVGLIVDLERIEDIVAYRRHSTQLSYCEPDAIIFDDPWGNFIKGYDKQLSGNDVVCPYDLAVKYLKPVNNVTTKWGYIFNKGASIV